MNQERKELELERKEMLDRLMSRDLVEFKESNEPPAPPLKDESKNGEKKEDSFPLTTRPLTEEEAIEVYGGEEK